jgi:phage recombination protein Bet
MSIIVGIDGFRTIADRTGNYRPDEDEPRYEIDPAIKGPSNPAGLIKATVSAFKFSHGSWHKVTASAYWDEYAPLKEEWSDTVRYEDGNWPDGKTRYRTKPAPGATKTMVLDASGNWPKMSRHMLAKVAEALTLRKAWPDDFSNVYVQEEVDRATILDLSPSEVVEAANVQNRLEIIGGANGLLFSWDDPNAALESVPLGQVADRCLAFIEQSKEEPALLQLWAQRNQRSLKEFWARAKGDALAVRAALDKAIQGASESQ